MKYKNLHFELAQLATLLRPGKAAMVPHLFFLSAIFFSFFFIPNVIPLPCPIVPATQCEHRFLDSHSVRRRTAFQLLAKTPYLCLAACRQERAVSVREGGWLGRAKARGHKWKNTKKYLVEDTQYR